MRRTDQAIIVVLGLAFAERLLKAAAVVHFFRRQPPALPTAWPQVSLIQPVTRGVHQLASTLTTRLQLDYPASIQHIVICDQADVASQRICQRVLKAHPAQDGRLVVVAAKDGNIASKIEKMQAGLEWATNEVFVFVDDDVALRPTTLRTLLPYLDQPRAGAVFGLACYTNWRNVWSSAMSAFVNLHVLLSYIPLTYLTEPFTITGHCFALRRTVFDQVGGLKHMAGRIDDDHELARRVSSHGLRSIQTPLIYEVDNDLSTLRAYLVQMQRWFVFPRLLMLPQLSRYDQIVTTVGSLGNLLPSMIVLLVVRSRSRCAMGSLIVLFGLIAAVYLHGERRYLRRPTPATRLLIMPVVAIVAPLQILWSLVGGAEVEWRGQRLRISRAGRAEVVR